MSEKKESIATVTGKLFDLLEPLDSNERQKTIAAALTLLGESPEMTMPNTGLPRTGGIVPESGVGSLAQQGTPDARAFFDEKDPRSKVEELTVAARYRELYQNAHKHTKDDLRKVIDSARRNFDDKKFNLDLNNAKIKGLFNKGKDHKLAYYGQQYVDALPDRNAIKAIRKPKQASRKKISTKKKS